ncbi:MAG: hypothetical protein FJ318_10040 [SAR202 cluster bacterium]|nr:hypothetical protein [SAR202 cluster bacterium]
MASKTNGRSMPRPPKAALKGIAVIMTLAGLALMVVASLIAFGGDAPAPREYVFAFIAYVLGVGLLGLGLPGIAVN